MRMLIRKDKDFSHDASIIQTLVFKGFVTGELKVGFPAENIAETLNVHDYIAHTRLHKVYVVYRGVEMVACREV